MCYFVFFCFESVSLSSVCFAVYATHSFARTAYKASSQGPPTKPHVDRELIAEQPKVSVSVLSSSVSESKPTLLETTPQSSPHPSPPSSSPRDQPAMADRRTIHQQSTQGFTGVNSPITVPPINNDHSWQIHS